MEENGIPESSKSSGLNLAEIREKIEQEPDRQFTSLGEVAETPAAVEFIHREFHREAAGRRRPAGSSSRRRPRTFSQIAGKVDRRLIARGSAA